MKRGVRTGPVFTPEPQLEPQEEVEEGKGLDLPQPKFNGKLTVVTVKLPEDAVSAIKELADRNSTTLSEIVREAVLQYLGKRWPQCVRRGRMKVCV
jgi:hypothetical protein